MNRIAAQFESFRKDVIPVDAPVVQVTEMRRAFYAGAAAILFITGDQYMTDDQIEAEIMSIKKELGQFVKNVTQGKS